MRQINGNVSWRIVRNPLIILGGFIGIVYMLLRLGPAIDGVVALLLWSMMIVLSVVVLVRVFKSGSGESAF